MAEYRRYSVFGLSIASQVELPELPAAPGDGPWDVRISIGEIAPRRGERPGLTIFPDGALLIIPEAGRFWMQQGAELIVEPGAGASQRNVRLYLLGSAFAAILHQRSLLPLHANAVVIGGKAIGFMGHPGAGKSTLAAWFHDNGYDVLSDDVSVATTERGVKPFVAPGIPRLRLWREALEISGRDADNYERSFDDMEKYTVPTETSASSQQVELSHLYVLERAMEAEGAAVSRLGGVDAVHALVANTYRGAYIPLMGKTKEHLLACVQLAGQVPVFKTGRKWGFEHLDAEAEALATHALRLIRPERD